MAESAPSSADCATPRWSSTSSPSPPPTFRAGSPIAVEVGRDAERGGGGRGAGCRSARLGRERGPQGDGPADGGGGSDLLRDQRLAGAGDEGRARPARA